MADPDLVPFAPKSGMNTSEARILEHVRANIRRPLAQAQPHDANDRPLIIAAGGPSLALGFEDLRRRHEEGAAIVSVNGSHDWLLDRGLTPAAFVMLDARPGNVRFVRRAVRTCRYLIASQCHPVIFDALAAQGIEPTIFHCDLGTDRLNAILDRHYYGCWREVVGGSTVTIRALMLFRMLGFQRFDIWGFDGCYLDGAHHAYPQPESAGEQRWKITVSVAKAGTQIIDDGDLSKLQPHAYATREFECAPWMAAQAKEFVNVTRFAGHLFELNIHGPGLIAWIVRMGALARMADAGEAA